MEIPLQAGEVLGLALLIAIGAFAIYALRRGRNAKPDGYRATDWLGERPPPDDRDLPPRE